MKAYSKPELKIDLFEEEDVIVCSGSDDGEGEVEWYKPEYDDE